MIWRLLFVLQLQPPVVLNFLLLSHSLLFLLFITVEARRAPRNQFSKNLQCSRPSESCNLVSIVQKGTLRLRQVRTLGPI